MKIDDTYPRPDFVRDSWWASLDGIWQLDLDGTGTWVDAVVPSPWESSQSGVARTWIERGRYRRMVALPTVEPDDQLIAHFQAVHYQAEVLVDGVCRETHVGGQLPFEVDLTDVAGRTVELGVDVHAPIDKSEIPHGKQRSIPADPYDVCSFTPCSGIWQSVWLECRPRTHLRSVRVLTPESLDRFEVLVEASGASDGCRVRLSVDGDKGTAVLRPGLPADLALESPRPWSPDDPHIYKITAQLWRDDHLLDTIICTAGLRTISTRDGALWLNGKRLYVRGVLDQGFWPTSGWTAPNLVSLGDDLRAAKAAGFNLVRKHLKLEDPRWLQLADQLGMLVWEEPPSTSRFSEAAVTAFGSQLLPMVERDGNHPSIIIWGLYNEEWGLDWDVAGDPAKAAVLENAYKELTAADPSRPVIDNSGWSHVRTDLIDWHIYSPDQSTWRAALAGLTDGLSVELGPGGRQHKPLFAQASGQAGQPILNSEYGTGTTSVERAWIMRWQTQELRRLDDQNGYVYCELYDIEHETAGVLTFDRQPKDDLGISAADVHAETVIILDVDPLTPGTDLLSNEGGIDIEARVSSHAHDRQRLTCVIAWGAPMSTAASGDRVGVAVTNVDPFVLSAPMTIRAELPAGVDAARLHLWLEPDGGGAAVAHTVLDVRRRGPDDLAPDPAADH